MRSASFLKLKLSAVRLHLAALTALTVLAFATTDAQSCPVATARQTDWVRHESAEFGVAISGPPSFEQVDWASRSDSSSPLFSLWQDAVTTVDFVGPTDRRAVNIIAVTGSSCLMKTAAGSFRLKMYRHIGRQYNGRHTTYFDAGGEIKLPGRRPMFVKLTAHDSVTLLGNLQMLQTLKLLKPNP